MFKILLLIVFTATGEPAVVQGPNYSGKGYATREECQAQIENEVEAATLLIDTDIRIEKGSLIVRSGKCFSEDEINRMRGGQSANEKNLHANFVAK